MSDREKKNALTPKETEQAVSDLAERLAEMDKAEGVFGEPVDDGLSDEYMEEIAGGAILPVTVGVITCHICGRQVDPTKTYGACPNHQPNENCPYYFKDR